MRELTVVELEVIGGAGWLKDGLSTIFGQFGETLWVPENSALNIQIAGLGSISLQQLAPDLGKTVGKTLGSVIGGAIETALTSLPTAGWVFTEIFKNRD
ncbi:hypothetical protein AAFL31_15975 [Klebsiella huaxiensis]|uniref:hypothetical protein n=1 Tax=Klebsiella huaxiensis TaxID=2153354 RepID=UPI0031660D32